MTTGSVLGKASHPTTVGTDVMDGVDAVRAELGVVRHSEHMVLCSSAGGGLRLAVVGYEREVTAEAGFRVGLSAGARVVHVASGAMTGSDLAALRASRPDLVLLVGGTDGGNADVLLHNARRLARGRIGAPVVVAGNAAAADAVVDELRTSARCHVVTGNVLPRIGEVAPEGARAAIREVFLRHVIGGKGLSRGRGFAGLVRAATPDAVLRGVEVLADVRGEDVLVVDVGGATTDVYSVITPQGEDAAIRREVVGPLWHARTVEADLGMRWNAEGVVEAARRERLAVPPEVAEHVGVVTADPSRVATTPAEWAAEEWLATSAVTVALRRHGRPAPGERPRPLTEVGLLVGSGGVLRHAAREVAARILAPALTDHAGGWRVPDRASAVVDRDYVLFAVGLLAPADPARARALARGLTTR